MRFDWLESEKEEFYQRAEQQLKDAGIDFVEVDRKQITVRGWNQKEKTAQIVFVALTRYSYRDLSKAKKQKLMDLGNWECIDKCGEKVERPLYMHSRLIFKEQHSVI